VDVTVVQNAILTKTLCDRCTERYTGEQVNDNVPKIICYRCFAIPKTISWGTRDVTIIPQKQLVGTDDVTLAQNTILGKR
jgi:hypothetical protein